jgi:hypothetical protein
VGLDFAGVVIGTDSRLARPLGEARLGPGFNAFYFTDRDLGQRAGPIAIDASEREPAVKTSDAHPECILQGRLHHLRMRRHLWTVPPSCQRGVTSEDMPDKSLSEVVQDMKWRYGVEKANALAHRPDDAWDRGITDALRKSLVELRGRLAAMGHGDNPFVTSDTDDAIYTLERLVQLGGGSSDAPVQRDAELMAAHLTELMKNIERMAAEIDGQ